MNLKDRLFKKPWQHKDAERRAEAVRDSDDPELLQALAELSRSDEAAAVRLAALRRINQESEWLAARAREQDATIRSAADVFLARELCRRSGDDHLEARLAWLASIEAAELLRRLAVEAVDLPVRRAALLRIQAQGFLGDALVSERDEALAAEILARIDQASTLERLGDRLRKTSKKRAQLVQQRLADLRAASGASDPDHDAAEALVRRAEALARGDSAGSLEARLGQILADWQSIRAPDAVLTRRFEGAVSIVRAALARPLPEPTVDPADDQADADPTPAAVDAGLMAAAEHIRDVIRQGRKSVPPQALLASWDRAWNQIKQPGEADQALKADLLPLLRELQAQVAQKTRQPDRTEPPAPDFDPRLDALGQLLEAGDIERGQAELSTLRSEYDRLPARQRAPAVAGRLQRMEGRLKEMRDWQHWSNNEHRDTLIEQVERLAESGQHPDAISAALKSAREEWQRMEAMEILPGDRKRFAAPPGQWRRFQAVCQAAFKQAQPFFQKRQALQQENQTQLEAFISMGEQLASDDSSEAQRLQETLRAARLAIRRLDDLPPRARGAGAARLRELMDKLSKRIDGIQDQIEAEKRALIEQARALADEQDLKTALAKAKALQARWQQVGSGRRKQEQKLWQAFREPIDPLFAKLKAARAERAEADQATLAELKDLCQQAEALAELPAEQLVDQRSQMNGLIADWTSRPGRPPKLEQRFSRAETRFRERIEQHKLAARDAARQQLETMAEQLQVMAERVLAGERPAPAAIGDAQDALEPGLAELMLSLQASADQLLDPDLTAEALSSRLEANAEAARKLAVELEFLSGLESPAEDRQLRMDYQVRRLAERMSQRGAQPDLGSELEQLQQRWYRSLPLPATQHAGLTRRVQTARAAIERMIGGA